VKGDLLRLNHNVVIVKLDCKVAVDEIQGGSTAFFFN